VIGVRRDGVFLNARRAQNCNLALAVLVVHHRHPTLRDQYEFVAKKTSNVHDHARDYVFANEFGLPQIRAVVGPVR
jgi:hypothetical protein